MEGWIHKDTNKARHGQLIHSADQIPEIMSVLHQGAYNKEILPDHYNCSFVSPSPTRQTNRKRNYIVTTAEKSRIALEELDGVKQRLIFDNHPYMLTNDNQFGAENNRIGAVSYKRGFQDKQNILKLR